MEAGLKEQIARPLGMIPSGSFVLTAAAEGKSTGIIASWVQQASFNPPIVTVAVKQGRPVAALIESSGHFVLNTIGEESGPLFKHFAKGFTLQEPAFTGLDIREEEAGIVLRDALADLRCKVVGKTTAGDHVVYLGEVIAGSLHRDGTPDVHIRNSGFNY